MAASHPGERQGKGSIGRSERTIHGPPGGRQTATGGQTEGATMKTTLVGVEQYGGGVVSEVIRPAAIVPEEAARTILATLQAQAVDRNGLWVATARQWARYDRTGVDSNGHPLGELVGCIEAVYGATTRYEVA